MAQLNRKMTLKSWPNKDADVEDVELGPESSIDIVQEWEAYFLVKDADGHYFNIAKDAVDAP